MAKSFHAGGVSAAQVTASIVAMLLNACLPMLLTDLGKLKLPAKAEQP